MVEALHDAAHTTNQPHTMNTSEIKAAAAAIRTALLDGGADHQNSIDALKRAAREIADAIAALEARQPGQPIPAVSGISNAMAHLTSALVSHTTARAFDGAENATGLALYQHLNA